MISLPAAIRSWLYVPANVEPRVEHAFATEADVVVLDLEDAVRPDAKEEARRLAADAIARRHGQTGPLPFVRVNDRLSGFQMADLAAVVGRGLAGVRLPKDGSSEEVRTVDDAIGRLEARAGLPMGGIRIVCNIESANGLWNAYDIARSSPRILALAFGAVDFCRDLG